MNNLDGLREVAASLSLPNRESVKNFAGSAAKCAANICTSIPQVTSALIGGIPSAVGKLIGDAEWQNTGQKIAIGTSILAHVAFPPLIVSTGIGLALGALAAYLKDDVNTKTVLKNSFSLINAMGFKKETQVDSMLNQTTSKKHSMAKKIKPDHSIYQSMHLTKLENGSQTVTIKKINKQGETITRTYDVGKKLGQGAYGEVFELTSQTDEGKKKVLKTGNISFGAHQLITKNGKIKGLVAFKMAQTAADFGIMSHKSGGSMNGKAAQNFEQSLDYTEQLLTNVKKMHDINMSINDLKADNILEENGKYFIADLDKASRLDGMRTVGDPEYQNGYDVAKDRDLKNLIPERGQERINFNKQHDLFSAGLCLRMFLTGEKRNKITNDPKLWYGDGSIDKELTMEDIPDRIKNNISLDKLQAYINIVNTLTKNDHDQRGTIENHLETIKNLRS